jgi:hypothetical protein
VLLHRAIRQLEGIVGSAGNNGRAMSPGEEP